MLGKASHERKQKPANKSLSVHNIVAPSLYILYSHAGKCSMNIYMAMAHTVTCMLQCAKSHELPQWMGIAKTAPYEQKSKHNHTQCMIVLRYQTTLSRQQPAGAMRQQ